MSKVYFLSLMLPRLWAVTKVTVSMRIEATAGYSVLLKGPFLKSSDRRELLAKLFRRSMELKKNYYYYYYNIFIKIIII